MPVLRLPVSEEQLAELEGEGDFQFFVRLPIHGQQRVVHIHIRHRKFYDLLEAAGLAEADDRIPRIVEDARLEPE